MGNRNLRARSNFARRAMLPRMLGLPVGAICVSVPLWELQRSAGIWVAVLLFAFAWPWLAFWLSRRSREPVRVERWNILFDSFAALLVLACAGFSPLASVVFFAMLTANNVAAGGITFVAVGLLVQVAGGLLGILLFGATFHAPITALHLYACIPMMVLHPMVVGLTLYQLAMTLGSSRKALRELSQTDSLTGLFNRRHWTELAVQQLQRCQRGDEPACLALIDIDHFKALNDSNGHLAGDALLTSLGEAIRVALRQIDSAGRYGGDEFCVLLPMTHQRDAHAVLERLREQARQLNTTLSIGVAAFHPRMRTVEDWIREADTAMYLAKQQGRDRVISADAGLRGGENFSVSTLV